MKTAHDFNTSSLGFPNMFEVSRSRLTVYTDSRSLVNRTRLLMLSNPTELYNDPEFGVGLKKYLFQYNTPNVKTRMQEEIKEKLALYEPKVKADETSFADGLLYTGDEISPTQEYNHLKMTMGLISTYGDKVDVSIDENDYKYDPVTKNVSLARLGSNNDQSLV